MKDNINKLVGFAEALFTKNSNAILAEKGNEHQVKKTTQKRCFTLALDRFNNGGYVMNLSNHIHS